MQEINIKNISEICYDILIESIFPPQHNWCWLLINTYGRSFNNSQAHH